MKRNTFIHRLQSEQGWTLMETLLVMGIILTLVSTVGFSAINQIGKSRQVTARNQIETFATALHSYYMDLYTFPTTEQGLESLWQAPTGMSDRWSGPYLSKPVPLDPWGKPYIYNTPGPNNLPFWIGSLGADGVEGGVNENKDVYSYE
jgi:general secretion pathway protein G